MNTKQNKNFRITWQRDAWLITDPHAPQDPGIAVDGAVVTATWLGEQCVEGFIVSVHGLDAAVAGKLNRQELNQLGVGGHLRAHAAPPKQRAQGTVYLLADGQIQRGR